MTTTKDEVEQYLKELSFKIGMWGILILDDRSKNAQSLHDLEIPPNQRKEIIAQLIPEDYYQGPLEEKNAWYLTNVGVWKSSKRERNLH